MRFAKHSGKMFAALMCMLLVWLSVVPTVVAEPEGFSLTYVGNGSFAGVPPTDSTLYQMGDTATVEDGGTLVRPMWNFLGWNTLESPTGVYKGEGLTGITYMPGAEVTLDGDLTLYAVWFDGESTPRKVIYDGNGHDDGDVPEDGTSYPYGTVVARSLENSSGLTKIGYKFDSWNTEEDGSGDVIQPGEVFTMTGTDTTITLYAQWKVNSSHTVGYRANAEVYQGDEPEDDNEYEAGDTVTVLGNGNLTREGYIFNGWNTEADGEGTSYAEGDTFVMGDSKVKLYAQWIPVPTLSVTYDANGNGNEGGTVPIDGEGYNIGDEVTVLGNTGDLTLEGYTFKGWNTLANGEGTSYTAGDMFEMGEGDVMLYAQWTAKPALSVTYDGNGNEGGTVPIDNGAYEISVTVSVYGNTGGLTRTGHTFTGWNTSADGEGTSYAAGDTFEMGEGDVTLYAQWTAKPTLKVTYNGNGNTGGTVPIDNGAYEISVMVSVYGNTGELTRTGYTFTGWNTSANGKGASYAAGDTFEMGEGDVTLYAQWNENPPEVFIQQLPVVKLVLESDPHQEGETAKTSITSIVGTKLSLSADLKGINNEDLEMPEIVINEKGEFSIAGVPAGEYKIALYVIAPTGEKLAGRYGKLTVQQNGNAVLESNLIDPYGIITDAVTGETIDDAKVTLHWSDTELNRSKGRVPHEIVNLPILPDFPPNQNHDPQWSQDGGQYGWMVFPDGDYYILAEKDGYVTFDSRLDPRDELQGEDSYIRNGIIHVGVSIVEYDFKMQSVGEHKPYMIGYPDGMYLPDRNISNAEVAAILSRLFVPGSPQAEMDITFTDIADDHWAASEIQLAARQGWMEGMNDVFLPEKAVTRGELAQIVARVMDWETTGHSSFTDVSGHAAEGAIAALARHGVLQGYPDGTFQPDRMISRVESNVVFNRLTGRKSRMQAAAPRWPDVLPGYWGYDIIMEASVAHRHIFGEDGLELWYWEE